MFIATVYNYSQSRDYPFDGHVTLLGYKSNKFRRRYPES